MLGTPAEDPFLTHKLPSQSTQEELNSQYRKTELYSWILKTMKKFKENVQIWDLKENRLKTLLKNVMF